MKWMTSLNEFSDFPADSGDKNLFANAGGMVSIPGPGRSHIPWNNQACVPQLLSTCSRTCPPQQEKPLQKKKKERKEKPP